MSMFLLILLGGAAAFFVVAMIMAATSSKKPGQGGGGGRASSSAGRSRSSSGAGASARREDLRLPYRYADDMIFVHGDSVWTGLVLPNAIDEYLNAQELQAMAEGPPRGLLNLARGDRNVECHYRKVYQPITAMTWAEDLNAVAWDPTDNYKAYNLRKAEYQERIGANRERNVLLVKLGSLKRSSGGSGVMSEDDEPYDEPGLLRGVRGAADHVAATATGVADEYLSPSVVAEWTQVATEVHESLETLRGTPLTREELVWLIRKPLHGDLPVPPEPVLGSRAWGPNAFDLVVDFSGENRKTHIVLNQYDEVTGEQQTSYTTTLVAANWPAETRFRQSTAWARYAAQHVDFPVEIDMRFTLIPYLKFKDRADKIRGNLVDEMNDMANSGRSPDTKLAHQVTRAQELVDDIEEHKMPGMEAQIRFTISAPSVKELERRRRVLEMQFKQDLKVTLLRPTRQQWRLLQSQLPGDAPKLPIAPYLRLQEVEQLGAGLPTAGTELGDNPEQRSGKRLGWVGNLVGWAGKMPVHYSLHVGPARNDGGGLAIVGASGGGKSSLALQKFYEESESGVRCLVIDPKTDFAQLCYYLAFGSQVNDPAFSGDAEAGLLGTPQSRFQPVNPEFWAETEVVDLLKGQAGVLDPWVIARDVPAGRLLAESMLRGFLGDEDYQRVRLPVIEAMATVVGRYNSAMRQAVDQGLTARDADAQVPRPTLWQVVDEVVTAYEQALASGDREATKDLKLAQMLLTELRTLPYARLAFSEQPQPLSAMRKRRTVITLRGFQSPAASDPRSWNPAERLAATALMAVVELGSQMLDVGYEKNPVTGEIGLRPKALFVDEAYVVTATESGRDLMRRALKQGRSYMAVTVLITQQAIDLVQIEDSEARSGGANQIHTVFAFKQKSAQEASLVAPLLGRPEDDPKVVAALQELRTGVCLQRDADKRVGTVAVDLVFKEILAATDTNGTTRPARQGVNPPLSVWDWTFLQEAQEESATTARSATPEPSAA
ncbi:MULTISPECIES: ATP-binding protein [Streptomyces]|uniref:ATP-binding protein n=1 Tax=Streptomyces caniscabiei TaxID=2746961 RepID=A0ABU4MKX6_9ACTN|nr:MULTISPECIES: ATP-binding protein [Streptomyces]MDX2941202.1 ATP-binding protein [Streptomyces caniscabiei]MDX2953515.1 ATP-binding protein [Streptomyces caniscabiei]MDX2987148.1 ATP-binding protein [Streptomyces caniscabiei]MDX3009798.1 ATP-binding protein [Streptomyces caniscabiei]MDX3037442.1 ATP-binding protein [Streptomyces caniscabiei]